MLRKGWTISSNARARLCDSLGCCALAPYRDYNYKAYCVACAKAAGAFDPQEKEEMKDTHLLQIGDKYPLKQFPNSYGEVVAWSWSKCLFIVQMHGGTFDAVTALEYYKSDGTHPIQKELNLLLPFWITESFLREVWDSANKQASWEDIHSCQRGAFKTRIEKAISLYEERKKK